MLWGVWLRRRFYRNLRGWRRKTSLRRKRKMSWVTQKRMQSTCRWNVSVNVQWLSRRYNECSLWNLLTVSSSTQWRSVCGIPTPWWRPAPCPASILRTFGTDCPSQKKSSIEAACPLCSWKPSRTQLRWVCLFTLKTIKYYFKIQLLISWFHSLSCVILHMYLEFSRLFFHWFYLFFSLWIKLLELSKTSEVFSLTEAKRHFTLRRRSLCLVWF